MARRLRPAHRVVRHPTLSETERGGLRVVEIAREAPLTVTIDEASDSGYHRYGNAWWTRSTCPLSYNYLAIETLYPERYFQGHSHPGAGPAFDLVDYMHIVFRALMRRELSSVLELGSGGGEITRALANRGLDYFAVEGTAAGVARLNEIGLDPGRILQCDLKFLPPLPRKFDLVMCTEVAEHIEPFFASKIVANCVAHADAVWFSAADRERAAHYHHINEVAIEAWDNLFAHMGMPFFVELDGRQGRASRLYLREAPAA